MKRCIAILCAAALLAPLARGQGAAEAVSASEFPGLQLLPPGSKVKGISLPRYEKNRVSAYIISGLMEIVSRTNVRFSDIRAELYAENGETTVVTCNAAEYDFRTKRINSATATAVDSTRFSAAGTGVTFSTVSNMGILKGPVRTTIKNSALNKDTKAK